MAKIVAIHSFRGGTGKSNTVANIAVLLAAEGRRVGVVDADIQSPGIHALFGLDQAGIAHPLNDYLWGRCGIAEVAQDVTGGLGQAIKGRIFLLPSSIDPGDITRVMREGYDVGLLSDGFRSLIKELALDILLVDTHPGLSEESLLAIAMSNVLVIVLRPDRQDYEGTSVTVTVARRLRVPRMLLVVNKTPDVFDSNEVRQRVEQAYDCDVAAVLPHSDELMVLSSEGIFALRYPDHPLTALYRQVANRVSV